MNAHTVIDDYETDDLGEPGDSAALAVLAYSFQRQRAVVE